MRGPCRGRCFSDLIRFIASGGPVSLAREKPGKERGRAPPLHPPVRRALKRRGHRFDDKQAGGIRASAPLMILQAIPVCFSGWLSVDRQCFPSPSPVSQAEASASVWRGGAIERTQVFPAPFAEGDGLHRWSPPRRRWPPSWILPGDYGDFRETGEAFPPAYRLRSPGKGTRTAGTEGAERRPGHE